MGTGFVKTAWAIHPSGGGSPPRATRNPAGVNHEDARQLATALRNELWSGSRSGGCDGPRAALVLGGDVRDEAVLVVEHLVREPVGLDYSTTWSRAISLSTSRCSLAKKL